MRPKKRIVLIDKNEERQSIRRFLLENKGFKVLGAASADEATTLYEACDLVVGCWPTVEGIVALARFHYQVPSLVIVDRWDDARMLNLNVDHIIAAAAPWEIFNAVYAFSRRKRGPKPSIATVLRRREEAMRA